MKDLSVLIAARNEEFLLRTVESILTQKRGNTEIIIVCDGNWPDPPIPDDPDVIMIYHPQSIGQRQAVNEAARLSSAKYVMKLDAHCVVDEGFDVKLMADCQPDWTVIPRMYNLHVFDWVCNKCGNRWYQSPTPKHCKKDPEGKTDNEKCDSTSFKRDIVWKPRLSRRSDFMRFDSELHFQYWGSYGSRPEAQGDIAEIMSFVGACFFMERARYWQLDGLDEEHGSWGQMGTEIACKSWLSGGRLVVNKKTWFSHMFRTQGGDFGFPYPISGKQTDHAKRYSQDIWKNNKWPKATRPLSWLLDKFHPIPGWESYKPTTAPVVTVVGLEPTKGIIYYTDNRINFRLAHMCRSQMKQSGLSVTSASLKPMHFGTNVCISMQRGYVAYHKQILAALEASNAEIVYFCEHDTYYHPSHFDFTPPKKDVYYYDLNWWRVRTSDGFAIHYETDQVNLICGYRETLLKHYKEKMRRIEKDGFDMAMGFEPGCNSRKEKIDDLPAERYRAAYPSLDLRYGGNLTKSRWKQSDFRNQRSCSGWLESDLAHIPGWELKNDAFTRYSL